MDEAATACELVTQHMELIAHLLQWIALLNYHTH